MLLPANASTLSLKTVTLMYKVYALISSVILVDDMKWNFQSLNKKEKLFILSVTWVSIYTLKLYTKDILTYIIFVEFMRSCTFQEFYLNFEKRKLEDRIRGEILKSLKGMYFLMQQWEMLHMWNLDSRSEIEISEVYIKTDIVTIINECTILFFKS